jgi:hypothetical protein
MFCLCCSLLSFVLLADLVEYFSLLKQMLTQGVR